MEQKRYEEIVDVANEEIQSAQEKIDKNYKTPGLQDAGGCQGLCRGMA